MPSREPRVDAYIAKSAEFARPILQHLREVVHQGCPDVEETIKWSMPFFVYKKRMFCNMAAFKEHCSFGFWKGNLIIPEGERSEDGMGHLGKITSLKDLPAKKVLLGYVKKAKQLHDEGVPKAAKPRPKSDRKLEIPAAFLKGLKKNKKAFATFEEFSYSHKKEYVEWFSEAKTEETRQRRLETTVEWLAQGKSRNWKYERC